MCSVNYNERKEAYFNELEEGAMLLRLEMLERDHVLAHETRKGMFKMIVEEYVVDLLSNIRSFVNRIIKEKNEFRRRSEEAEALLREEREIFERRIADLERELAKFK